MERAGKRMIWLVQISHASLSHQFGNVCVCTTVQPASVAFAYVGFGCWKHRLRAHSLSAFQRQ